MARIFMQSQDLTAIGDALREANVTDDKFLPSEMPDAILDAMTQFAPKKRVSGEIISVNDAEEWKPLDMKLFGKSSQNTVPGNQLFDVSKVIGNEYVINNQDGSITFNGAYANNNGYHAAGPCTLLSYAPTLEVGKTYTLNATTTANSCKYVYLSGQNELWKFGTSKVMTETILNSYINWYSDDVGLAATISDIMLNEGTTALPWEPYVGGEASPNINYPQPIVSVGQKLASGAQLLVYPYCESDLTANGLTFTGTNGHFSVKGTTTAGMQFTFMKQIPVGSYGVKVSNVLKGMHLLVYDVASKSVIGRITNGSSTLKMTFAVTEGMDAMLYVNQSDAGVEVDIDVDIMMTTADLIDSVGFEPYFGRGVNLLDESTIFNQGGGYRYCYDNPMPLQGGQTYTLKTYGYSVAPTATIIYSDSTEIACNYGAGQVTFTLETDMNVTFRLWWQNESDIPPQGSVRTQLEKGSVATPYEPHGINTNPVYDVGIEEKMLSGNLFDIYRTPSDEWIVNNRDGSITFTGVHPTNYGCAASGFKLSQYAPDLVAGKTYTLNAVTTSTNKHIYISGDYNGVWMFGTSKEVTEDVLNSVVYWYSDEIGKPATISDVMLNEGTVALPYQPHTEQTLTFPYVLRGVPINTGYHVSPYISADYIDSDGIQYVGDRIDTKRKKLIRKIGCLTEPVFSLWSDYAVEDSELFATDAPNSYSDSDMPGLSSTLCNMLNQGWVAGSYLTGCYQGFYRIFVRIKGISDVNELNELMKGSVFYYILMEPEEIDLTDDEIKAYKALMMNSPNTTIINSAGAMQEVIYLPLIESEVSE